MKAKSDIGLVGLAVMGQNLVLNMNDHGYAVSVFNRTPAKTEEFMKGPAAGRETITAAYDIEEFVASLKQPRRVMLMVKAGHVVDNFISMLVPLLDPGDIIIDGGNSHFPDTTRRTHDLGQKGLLYIGTGVSGGEEGARHGPSIMPGGSRKAWPAVKNIFQSISAKTPDGAPCCDWVGPDGAGHYVKMIHNGIEYGDMQLIAEAYHLLHKGCGIPTEELGDIFEQWNKTELESFLIEITAEILKFKDTDGSPLVERILDAAGQKGTGKWTGINALELGVPVTLIVEAVFARALSAHKDERVQASHQFEAPNAHFTGNRDAFVEKVRQALYAAKIVSYAQGFMQIREAAHENHWTLDFGSIAQLWRGGCIIRSRFLGEITKAFEDNPKLKNLLLAPFFQNAVQNAAQAWRDVVAEAVRLGIPVPAFASALSFFDGYRSATLPANIIQAQRDYFGAHTYERTDHPRGEFFHTNWTGSGGNVSAGTYNA